jgi:hypothetical protein
MQVLVDFIGTGKYHNARLTSEQNENTIADYQRLAGR